MKNKEEREKNMHLLAVNRPLLAPPSSSSSFFIITLKPRVE